jgi:hypothetical protein
MTLRKRHSSSPTVGASLKAGMQIYSTRSSGAGLERASSYREAKRRDVLAITTQTVDGLFAQLLCMSLLAVQGGAPLASGTLEHGSTPIME